MIHNNGKDFDICENTENRLQFIQMDNSLHTFLQLERIKRIYQFSCKNCEETSKEQDN